MLGPSCCHAWHAWNAAVFWQPLRVFKPAANHFSVLRKAHAQCLALHAAMHGMHGTLRFFWLPLRVPPLGKTRRKPFFRTTVGRCAVLGPSCCHAWHAWNAAVFLAAPAGSPPRKNPQENTFLYYGRQVRSARPSQPCDATRCTQPVFLKPFAF